MKTDSELLGDYARTGSQAAFSELVGRHVNMVYGSALRILNGDSHLAEDVSQSVFAELARKADWLSKHPTLSGWLYTSSCYSAAKTVRSEQRRKAREQEALAMSDLNEVSATDWEKLRPILDQAMLELNAQDRESIVLRYFENLKYSELGAQMGMSDNAARMKVDRAMDRLRSRLTKRGVSSGASALAFLLEQQVGAVSAPAGLSASITALAGVGVGTSAFWGFSLAKSMSVGAALLVGTATIYYWNHQRLATNSASSPIALQTSAHKASTSKSPDNPAPAHALPHQAARPRPATFDPKEKIPDDAKGIDSHLPEPILQIDPIYPEHLKAKGSTGEVVINFVVDAFGQVQTPYVASSSSSDFESAAFEALAKTAFTPGINEGKAVNTRMSMTFKFHPTNSVQAAPLPRSEPD